MGETPSFLTQARSTTTATPSRLRGYKRVLVATDYLGTLCDLGADHCPPEIVLALTRLSQLPQVTLALVTGCCGSELSRIKHDLPPCWTISDHGRACIDPAGGAMRDWPSNAAGNGPVERAWLQAEAHLHDLPVRLQRKRFSVAVHSVTDIMTPGDNFRLNQWANVCRSFGLEIVPGRRTTEAMVPGFDKRRALLRLSAHLRCDFRVYAGDDTSDLNTLADVSARPDGIGIYVASPERPEPGTKVSAIVDGPIGLAMALSELADVLENLPGT